MDLKHDVYTITNIMILRIVIILVTTQHPLWA